MEIVERAVFRVTRDADFEVSDEADDLLEAVESELRRRRFGDVVRLEVARSVSTRMLGAPDARAWGRATSRSIRSAGRSTSPTCSQIAALDRPELKDEPWVPSTHARLAAVRGRRRASSRRSARGDVLVHHPYDSFATSVERFVGAAARDPAVIALKTTVYRTSDESPRRARRSIEAAEDGKQSVCLVELKARFDEHRNIEWSRALERAGVHVVYGFPNLKIHAKTTLVVRREGNTLRRYVHIGTGNYHALTARIYEDFGLFTADEEIAADVADLFNYVTGFGRPQAFRKLLVAPFNLRRRLVEQIRAVAEAAADGEPAAHPAEGERAHRPGDHRGAVRGLAGRRRDRHRRRAASASSGPGSGALGDDPRAQRARALPRAQPLLRRSRRARRPPPSSAAPT